MGRLKISGILVLVAASSGASWCVLRAGPVGAELFPGWARRGACGQETGIPRPKDDCSGSLDPSGRGATEPQSGGLFFFGILGIVACLLLAAC